MYSNNILNFQESTTILNTCTKKFGKLLNAPRINFSVFLDGFMYISCAHTRIRDKNDICNIILLDLHFYKRLSIFTEKRIKI